METYNKQYEESVKDWRIYITTRSKGFPYHGCLYDFWRYEIEDMKRIFVDFIIITLEKDHQAPGVFLKARKPENYVPADLSNIALYSIVLGRRTRGTPNIGDTPLIRRLMLRLLSSKARWPLSILASRFLRLIKAVIY